MTVPIYRPLGAFRLLLAVLVVLQHMLANLAPEALSAATLPYESGSVAVLAFFALSGFVISEATDTIYRDRPGAYLANRLLRIVPLFLITVAATILVLMLFQGIGTLRMAREGNDLPADVFGAKNVIANLLGFAPLANRVMSFDVLPIAWAIRAEMLFYVILAVAMLLSLAARRAGFARWTPARVGLSIAALLTVPFVLAVRHRAPEIFALVPYFVLGCALYAVMAHKSRTGLVVVVLSLAAAAWEFGSRQPTHPVLGFERAVGFQGALLVLLLGVMVVLASRRVERFRRLDRSLGDLTYPLYLTHCTVMIVVLSMTAGYSALALVIGLAMSVAIAALARALVDPSVNRLRDRVRSGRSIGPLRSNARSRQTI